MLLASHLFFSCPYIPNDCEIVGDYEFVLPATLTPAKDTFQIGDTINVVSRFSDSLYERKTDQVYQAEDFKWSPLTYIYRLDTINGQSDFSRFDFILNVEYDYTIFNYSKWGVLTNRSIQLCRPRIFIGVSDSSKEKRTLSSFSLI